jgi:hypothetical protein
VHEDGAAESIPAGCGNIVARFAPTATGGVPIMFGAHLDTVPLTGPVEVELVGDGKEQVLEQIELYRGGLGERLRRVSDEIIDAEFSEEELPSLAPADAAP